MTGTHIQKLVFSSQMQQLVERSGDFDVMQILGVSSRELAYSNIFAFFLDPKGAHRFGAKPLVSFLRHVNSSADGDILPFSSLLGEDVGRVRVRREYKGIDLLIELTDETTVLAIENKVYAGEQPDQVARYQAMLTREYPRWTRGIAFLTPSAANPQTHDPESDVPVVKISYRSVAEIFENNSAGASTGAAAFASAVASNIRQRILEEHPMKDKIYALWADREFSDALSEIVYHAPRLSTYKDEFSKRIVEWAESQHGLNVSSEELYPKRGEPYELALRFRQWDQLGLPVTLKFYWYQNTANWNDPGCQPAIRAFIWWKDFNANQESFQNLAACGHDRVSENFAPIKSWTNWRRFFAEDDYPQDSFIPFRSEGFTDVLVAQACSIISEVNTIVRAGGGK